MYVVDNYVVFVTKHRSDKIISISEKTYISIVK